MRVETKTFFEKGELLNLSKRSEKQVYFLCGIDISFILML